MELDGLLRRANKNGWPREAIPGTRDASEWTDLKLECTFSTPEISFLKNMLVGKCFR
jgi:hypothetical protein